MLRAEGNFSTAPALSRFQHCPGRLVTVLTEAATGTPPRDTHWRGGARRRGGPVAQAVLHFWANGGLSFLSMVEYRIVEIGTGLRQRQREACPHSSARVVGCWGEDFPKPVRDGTGGDDRQRILTRAVHLIRSTARA